MQDLSPGLTELLREFARAQGVTPFMAMLAAFYVLLQRYSGAGELIVGSGMANRRLRELDAILGMIINTVALRVDLSDDPSLTELLGRVRAAVLQAQENQDVPFPRVVEAVAPARSSSHTPLYQTLFSIADAPLPDLDVSGLEIVPDESPGNGSAKAEINVVVVNHDGRGDAPTEPTIIWEYNSDLFSAATAERMARDDCRVLSRSSRSQATASPRSRCWRTTSATGCWSIGTTRPPTTHATRRSTRSSRRSRSGTRRRPPSR